MLKIKLSWSNWVSPCLKTILLYEISGSGGNSGAVKQAFKVNAIRKINIDPLENILNPPIYFTIFAWRSSFNH
jgi:hypothetical protein